MVRVMCLHYKSLSKLIDCREKMQSSSFNDLTQLLSYEIPLNETLSSGYCIIHCKYNYGTDEVRMVMKTQSELNKKASETVDNFL